MKKAVLLTIAIVLLLQPLAFVAGCGGGDQQGFEEEAVDYAVENILIPEQRDSDFIVEWMRQVDGVADDSPEELGLRFWKWEGGALTVITLEEFQDLAAQRAVGDPRTWIYSQHSVTVLEAGRGKGRSGGGDRLPLRSPRGVRRPLPAAQGGGRVEEGLGADGLGIMGAVTRSISGG